MSHLQMGSHWDVGWCGVLCSPARFIHFIVLLQSCNNKFGRVFQFAGSFMLGAMRLRLNTSLILQSNIIQPFQFVFFKNILTWTQLLTTNTKGLLFSILKIGITWKTSSRDVKLPADFLGPSVFYVKYIYLYWMLDAFFW